MTAPSGLRDFLARRDDAEGAVDPTMRSTVLPGQGETTVLLLHGLTASPPAWSAIAAELNARGATVVALRLPLHGHRDRLTTALERMSSADLVADVANVIAAIAPFGKRLVIGGHSLGGTLALHAAATLPAVDRVVAIAPFLGIASVPHELHVTVIGAIGRLPNLFLWWDRSSANAMVPRTDIRATRWVRSLSAWQLRMPSTQMRPVRHVPEPSIVVNAGESSVNNRTVMRLARRWRRAGGTVAVTRLDGLPPSHDIIEPARANSSRVRETLVRLLLDDEPPADAVHPI